VLASIVYAPGEAPEKGRHHGLEAAAPPWIGLPPSASPTS